MVGTQRYARPTDWKRFQILVRDLLKEEWDVILEEFGRPGQKQHGSDLIAIIPAANTWNEEFERIIKKPELAGKSIVVQCKHRVDGGLSYADIKKEYVESDSFKEIDMGVFVVATSLKRDATLQTDLIKGSSEIPLFKGILFWDNFEQLLDEYEVVRERYGYSTTLSSKVLPEITRVVQQGFANYFEEVKAIIVAKESSESQSKQGLLSPVQREIDERLLIMEQKTCVDYRTKSTRDLLTHSQEMFESNEYSESLQSVLTLALRFPKEPTFWMGLSVLFLHSAQFDNALWTVEKGLEINPKLKELHMLKCAAFLGNDELHKAAESATSSMKEIGVDSNLLSLRGSALMRMRNIKAALRDFRDAYNLAEDKTPKLVADYVGYLLGERKYKEAIDLITKEIETTPQDMTLRTYLANAFYLNEEYEKAVDEFEKIANSGESLEGYEGSYGLSLREIGRCQEGLEFFKKHMNRYLLDYHQSDKMKSALWSELAEFHLVLRDFESAQDCLDKAEDLYPDIPGTIQRRGFLHYLSGDHEKAEECFQEALKKSPNRPDILLHNANAQLVQDRFDEAIETLEKARSLDNHEHLQIDREIGKVWLLKSRDLDVDFELKRTAGQNVQEEKEILLQSILKSIQYHPSPEAYETLLKIHLLSTESSKAIQACIDGLKLDIDPIYRASFAAYLLRLGEESKAVDAAKELPKENKVFLRIRESIFKLAENRNMSINKILADIIEVDEKLFTVYDSLFAVAISKLDTVRKINSFKKKVKEALERELDNPLAKLLLMKILGYLGD